MPAYAVCDGSDGGDKERNDDGTHDGQAEELFQEIADEARQPSHTPVSLAYVVPIEQEQVHLLPSYEVIRVCELEESERRKER